MRGAAVRNLSLYFTRTFLSHPSSSSSSKTLNVLLPRFFSSESDSSDQNPKPTSPESALEKPEEVKESAVEIADVDNDELKLRIEKYFKGDEAVLPSIVNAIMQRKLSGQHEDTDDELAEELSVTPLDGVQDIDFEEDFEEGVETDEEIENLYSARDIVTKRMLKNKYFNMDDKKWDDLMEEVNANLSEGNVSKGNVSEGDRSEGDRSKGDLSEGNVSEGDRSKGDLSEGNVSKGDVSEEVDGVFGDMRGCEEILEDMLHGDTLLPDDIKLKVNAKLDELGNQIENQKLDAEEAFKQYQEFEDQIVNGLAESSERNRSDDPPGVGPVLRWQSRVVFAPGGDAWHPKNRKVKLSVTVKELGLSKYQFRRMREIVGKRYHPGKDELTIISERFEEREENRKDCLRTLLNIVEEAGKADAIAEEVQTAYVKGRLKANAEFMARLHAKMKQSTSPIST